MVMTRFYFDHIDNGTVCTDDDGADVPGIAEAGKEARLCLGEEAKTFVSQGREGRLEVVVRDERGPLLEKPPRSSKPESSFDASAKRQVAAR